MGHLDVAGLEYFLPDGRPLLGGVGFRVGEGARMALVGPNGTGKTTLLRIIAGELDPHGGTVTGSGRLGVMPQFIGMLGRAAAAAEDESAEGAPKDEVTVRDLLVQVAPPRVRRAARAVDSAELAIMQRDDEPAQLAYAQALADWAEVGGYEFETHWDACTVAALGIGYEKAQWRDAGTLSGGEQKRLVLESLVRGDDDVLLLDEPDNYLDVPAKQWLEEALVASPKTILLVSHDRELLDRVATRVVTLEPTGAGATAWVHPGGFGTYRQARIDRMARLEEQRKRWDEEHAKLGELVRRYKAKAAYNSDMASRYRSAQTRLARFEAAGPPEALPQRQHVTMRLTGGRTAKRAVICEGLSLYVGDEAGDALPGGPAGPADVRAFDTELWYGERVAVLGPNGSGKSHFLQLLAAGGTDPDPQHRPVGDVPPPPVRHRGVARLGSRVRPGWFRQGSTQGFRQGSTQGFRQGSTQGFRQGSTQGFRQGSTQGFRQGSTQGFRQGSTQGFRQGSTQGPALAGRTLLQVLHRGDAHRDGMPREQASRALDRYGLARCAEQTFDSLSGGQQARFQILLLELSGATLLLLDEPTDNLDLQSAEALEDGLARFSGTVVAVTHDRWFARGFDRFLVFGEDGRVRETAEPVWGT